MSTDAARLACFEGLADLGGADTPSVEPVPEAGEPPAEALIASPEEVPEAPTAEPAAAAAAEAADDRADEREYTEPPAEELIASPEEVPEAPTVEPAAPAGAAPAVEAADDSADEFGREYLEDDEEESDTLTATVNEVTIDRTNRLVFRFANGQVWRQLEPRRFQYPRREAFDVVISRGVLGDYQLRVGGEGRMTRIKRVK